MACRMGGIGLGQIAGGVVDAFGGCLGDCSSQHRGAPDPGMVLKAPSRGVKAVLELIQWINSSLNGRSSWAQYFCSTAYAATMDTQRAEHVGRKTT